LFWFVIRFKIDLRLMAIENNLLMNLDKGLNAHWINMLVI